MQRILIKASTSEDDASNSLVDDLKVRFRIMQESSASGSGFKQTVANVIAGEYNEAEVKAEVEELINSAPCGKLRNIIRNGSI